MAVASEGSSCPSGAAVARSSSTGFARAVAGLVCGTGWYQVVPVAPVDIGECHMLVGFRLVALLHQEDVLLEGSTIGTGNNNL